jgi:hypothetical protein
VRDTGRGAARCRKKSQRALLAESIRLSERDYHKGHEEHEAAGPPTKDELPLGEQWALEFAQENKLFTVSSTKKGAAEIFLGY